MALGDNYVTPAELKARLGLTSTTDDTRVEGAVETASREIESYCNRQFNKVAVASERKFYGTKRMTIVDDFHTITDLAVVVVEIALGGVTTSTTLTSIQYAVEPRASVTGQFSVARPFWKLRNLNTLNWPAGPDDGYLSVTAIWGWAEVPAPIKEATYILAEEVFKMKEAPFGVANWGEFGPMRVSENRVVARMLSPYTRGRTRVA